MMIKSHTSLVKEEAIRLINAGFYLTPIMPNTKRPTSWYSYKLKEGLDERLKTISHVSKLSDRDNLAIFLGDGKPGELIVIDIDVNKKQNGFSTLETRGYDLPYTLVNNTANGGKHYFYWIPEGLNIGDLSRKIKRLPGIDLLVRGYSVVYPSKIDGKAYTWHDRPSTDEDPISFDEIKVLSDDALRLVEDIYKSSQGEVYALGWESEIGQDKPLKSSRKVANLEDLAKPNNTELFRNLRNELALPSEERKHKIQEGQRHDLLLGFALSLRSVEGYTASEIMPRIMDVAENACDPPFTDREELRQISDIVRDACRHINSTKTLKNELKEEKARGQKADPEKVKRLETMLEKSLIEERDNKARDIYNFPQNSNKPTKVNEGKALRYFKLDYKDQVIVKNGKLWLFEGGIYKLIDKSEMVASEWIQKNVISPRLHTAQAVNNLNSLIMADMAFYRSEDHEWNQIKDGQIIAKNGLYDPTTKTLSPLKPKHYALNQIPHKIDLNLIDRAKDLENVAPNFYKFLYTTFSNKGEPDTILDFMTLCLCPIRGIQKMLWISGKSGVGKSELLRVIEKVIGKSDNITYLGLETIGIRDRNFALADLQNSMLNISADESPNALKYTSNFKSLTGGDGIRGEYKHGASFTFYPYTKFIVSSNHLPKVHPQDGEAINRRMLYIEVPRRGEYIPNLSKALDGEIKGIFHHLISRLPRLKDQGFQVYETDYSTARKKEITEAEDTIEAFINNFFDEETNYSFHRQGTSSRFVIKPRFYDGYRLYCEANNSQPMSNKKLYNELKAKGYKLDNDTKVNNYERIIPLSFYYDKARDYSKNAGIEYDDFLAIAKCFFSKPGEVEELEKDFNDDYKKKL